MSDRDGPGPDVRTPAPAGRATDDRTPAERQADHDAIDRLTDELLPALAAKLGASGLGELEVREGGWRVRLRMPADGRGARRAGGPGRGPGRGEAHATGGGQAAPGHGPARPAGALHPAAPPHPVGAPHSAAAHPAPPASPADRAMSPDPAAGSVSLPAAARAVATSPAVGFFRPLPDLAAGARVRAGDRLGVVDVLGVLQEVVAPADGVVGATLVEPGDPVEYGQDVVEVELPGGAAGPGEAG